MNTREMRAAVDFMLELMDMEDREINFYFPMALRIPSPRYMAWDTYGPESSDCAELTRYGGKAYYIEDVPLSIILAKAQLLTGIATMLKCHFKGNDLLFAAMLNRITVFASVAIAKLMCDQM